MPKKHGKKTKQTPEQMGELLRMWAASQGGKENKLGQ
jgi:hypothetical protein